MNLDEFYLVTLTLMIWMLCEDESLTMRNVGKCTHQRCYNRLHNIQAQSRGAG